MHVLKSKQFFEQFEDAYLCKSGCQERLHGPPLPQPKLVCNPVWRVELNNIEIDQRAPHQVLVFVLAAHGAQPNVLELLVIVQLPSNL